MSRHHFGLTSVAGLAILFAGTPLRAQDAFHPDSQFGPYAYQATLIPGGTSDEEFGRRVAIVGDAALVAGTGIVYVFERDSRTDGWREVEPLQHAGPVEQFGRALAFDKHTAIVGSLGSAHLFRRNARGRWREVATLTPRDGHPNFGASVAIAGNQVIVGALGTDSTPGAAYIFRRDRGSAAWNEVVALPSTETSNFASRGFAYSVGITSDAAVVAEVLGPNLGAVSIYARDAGGVDNWGRVRRTTIGGATFPGGVAIEHDTAVFGHGEINAGALIFSRDDGGPGNWGNPTSYGSRSAACCGTFRAVQIDGDRIILGLSGLGTGVHILARNQGGPDAWERIASFVDVSRNTPFEIALGEGVAISGDTALLGGSSRGPRSVNKGVFVIVSDLDGDGVRDGIDPCPRDPLNNVEGSCKRSSAAHPVLDDLIVQNEVTSETQNRRQLITATFTNTGTTAVKNPFFEVIELTGDNLLANADEGRGGVGATLSPDVGDGILSPGESMSVTFRIHLRTRDPFQFFVAFHGDPLPQ